MKYLIQYPDGDQKQKNSITTEEKEFADDGSIIIYKFEDGSFFIYITEGEWEKVEEVT